MKEKTIIYVLNKKGKPLMPTTRCGKVRRLLKEGKAVAVNNNPFTIRLKYETPDIVQSLTVGIDTGRETIGEGVSDEEGKCYFLCITETHNKSIKKQMQDRASHRHSRRHYARQKKQRKALRENNSLKNGEDAVLRSKKSCKSISISYPGMDESITSKVIRGKEAQFNNRVRPEGWLIPSGRQLIQVTLNCLKQTMKILPISAVNIERVSFDFQKLENINIKNWEYSKGPLYGFADYKDYINAEQKGRCLLCGKPHIDAYHHIVPVHKGGSDSPKNIAGLCYSCHNGKEGVHKNTRVAEQLVELKEGLRKKYKVSLLNSVMPTLIEELYLFCKENNLDFAVIDGYSTYQIRTNLDLNKTHCIDGYCISRVGKETKLSLFPKEVYKRRRFKKKSNHFIHALNSRVYKLDGKVVATNRHKAMEQKKSSLEDYMSDYADTHSDLECRQHFHELEICPAKRTYSYHKKGVVSGFHPGDKVRYAKHNKINGNLKSHVFICESVDMHNNRLYYGGNKNSKIKYCHRLCSGSLSYI